MYRIELSPGEETVFRSIEELAVAIKRGVVTPRARIYHNASSKWLPIQFHPHYRVALSMPLTQSALVAGPPVKPLSSLTLDPLAEPEPPVSIPGPLPRVQTSEPVRKKKPAKEKSGAAKRSGRPGKQHRQLRIALIGALLLGGAQWVLSEPLFSRTEASELFRTNRRLMATPANTAAMLSGIARGERPSAAFFGGRSRAMSDSALEIEPAPPPVDMSVPPVHQPDSLAAASTDSAKQKAIKGILRPVGGTSNRDKPPGPQ